RYRISVENPGSVSARDLRVMASVPVGGSLDRDAADGTHDRQFDPIKRQLHWFIPQIGPGERVELAYGVRLGGVQLYQVTAYARAEGPIPLSARDTCSTDVTGMADVNFQVVERRRVLDEGEETDFEIRIQSQGSKDAGHILVRALLSDHLQVVSAGGI